MLNQRRILFAILPQRPELGQPVIKPLTQNNSSKWNLSVRAFRNSSLNHFNRYIKYRYKKNSRVDKYKPGRIINISLFDFHAEVEVFCTPKNRWACLLIFTKVFTCRAHIKYRNFSKVTSSFQCCQYCSSVVGDHLKTTSINYVHFFTNFA